MIQDNLSEVPLTHLSETEKISFVKVSRETFLNHINLLVGLNYNPVGTYNHTWGYRGEWTLDCGRDLIGLTIGEQQARNKMYFLLKERVLVKNS